jgi:exonuclease SbcC|tara:strand:+ start:31440 stop:33506 length:2067 start_codon:yes stop_codon:yes gene_type:complete
MFLKSIKLHNIRSYENQEIKFPLGSVLLAGDIGSGKSTILLAVEFALFGAKKGELPAYMLLKHGKKEGNVELQLQIDSKNIVIKRNLKRSKEDIKQEAGYVIINGIKKEGTTEELRAFTLELLGYPKELIKKGKDLIYRYTVYTPQEEMKQILYENTEARLDTLRKVFNIDKYKRIKDNSKIITASLREKKKHFEGFILDLEYKKKDLEDRKNEIVETDSRLNEIFPKIDDIKKIIDEKKRSIENIEKDIIDLNNLRKEQSVTEANLSHRIEQNNRLNDEIKNLEKQIGILKKILENKKLDDYESIIKKIDEKEKEINEADLNYRDAIKKIKGIEVKIEQCNETIRKIDSLEICPVCEQEVDEKHKHDINSREKKKHEELLENINNFKDGESKLEKVKIQLKKDLDLLVKEQNHYNILKMRFENLNEKESTKKERSSLKEKIKKQIGLLNSKKLKLNERIGKYSETEEKYKIVKKEIDGLLPQERFLELEKRKYETEKLSIKRLIVKTEKEINEKQKAKEKLAYISQLNNWIGEFFMNLMSNMEKHVMINIHSQFNDLFKNWFDILMEDEAISVRVDDEFTPIIEQDGYETYIENLSGGEKTSVALSYRLALNKVINDIVVGIKTKDIIMLDEPTDGFSTEQLDKVREILDQLNMKQVIIVSHEPKIEGYVENVVRVQKQDNVSMVAQ